HVESRQLNAAELAFRISTRQVAPWLQVADVLPELPTSATQVAASHARPLEPPPSTAALHTLPCWQVGAQPAQLVRQGPHPGAHTGDAPPSVQHGAHVVAQSTSHPAHGPPSARSPRHTPSSRQRSPC